MKGQRYQGTLTSGRRMFHMVHMECYVTKNGSDKILIFVTPALFQVWPHDLSLPNLSINQFIHQFRGVLGSHLKYS